MLTALGQSDAPAVFLLIAGSIVATIALWHHARTRPQLEYYATVGVLTANQLLNVHDFGRVFSVGAWDGMGFFWQPFTGITLFIVFFLSLGRRYVRALGDVEGANEQLAAAVAQTRNDLTASETRRRELEVSHAIEQERDRLMREIHDGIGANLVTALAVAEQQGQPPGAIRVLKKALADLKITVDSLEPVEGDIALLLASLRHRMAPDLAAAGLACYWLVAPCPALAWLDATNALHVLRIFQEAIGNAISHAGASGLEIGCGALAHDGRPGVTAWIADDGCGLPDQPSGGRGLHNMAARAASLHGWLECTSPPAGGTRVTLWLPLERQPVVL